MHTGKRVGATLQHHCAGLEGLHDLGNDRYEDGFVRLVVHPVPQRDVHRVVLALPGADVSQVTCVRRRSYIRSQLSNKETAWVGC